MFFQSAPNQQRHVSSEDIQSYKEDRRDEKEIETRTEPSKQVSPKGETEGEKLWGEVSKVLATLLSENVFSRWFADASLVNQSDGTWNLFVPSSTHCLWIETNFLPELHSALASKLDHSEAVQVQLKVASSEPVVEPLEEKKDSSFDGEFFEEFRESNEGDETDFQKCLKKANINPTHSFERFVVGGSNEFAHAACYAVAQGRGRAYNPLFIHGGVGLGKTHLTQALGQEFLKNQPKKKVAYLTCEQFTNEFIDAVQKGNLTKFRNRYRKVEVLIVDDVQFLKNKAKTGDEFFHTFNALLGTQAQIILTSDRPACEIQSLEPRLMTRFESGLTVALEPPVLETRIAILQKKMTEWNVELSHEILTFIAERVSSSVRRLEGALVRVATYSSLGSGGLTLERVESLLRDIFHEESTHRITMDSIQTTVAEYFDLRIADMTSRRRPRNIAYARQVAMYLSRKLTDNSLMEIGEAFGGRDHGTIIHAVKKVEALIESEASTRDAVAHLSGRLSRS